MARHSAPGPFKSRRASTTFLKVPASDWSWISQGRKPEFRLTGRALSTVELPTPVVIYTGQHDRYRSKLMVLTSYSYEALGGISPESLERECQPSMAHFRRYWMGRTRQRFKPLQMVSAYVVRPWTDGDRELLGAAIVGRLYGEHL